MAWPGILYTGYKMLACPPEGAEHTAMFFRKEKSRESNLEVPTK